MAIVVGGGLGAGCESDDVGQPCPQLLQGNAADTSNGQTTTQEVVEQNVGFPCQEMVCIATAGRSGYCTKKCRTDAGCPSGFVCREIQPIGDFAGEKFCAWKPCDSRADCGSVNDFCCTPVPGSDPVEDLKYCAFSNDGKCS